MALASGFLLLMAWHAVLTVAPRRPGLWIAAAMSAWACTFATPLYALARPVVVLLFNLEGVPQRIGHPEALAAAYRIAVADLTSAPLAVLLHGGADLYPVDQAVIIANTTRWDPRPVFQSYAAYTPFLAELNAAHLAGPSRPQTLLFRVAAIDGRFPALDDGPSWLSILSSYRLLTRQNRTPCSASPTPGDVHLQ